MVLSVRNVCGVICSCKLWTGECRDFCTLVLDEKRVRWLVRCCGPWLGFGFQQGYEKALIAGRMSHVAMLIIYLSLILPHLEKKHSNYLSL